VEPSEAFPTFECNYLEREREMVRTKKIILTSTSHRNYYIHKSYSYVPAHSSILNDQQQTTKNDSPIRE
jgi:hypothetical protein